jgi:dTDP-glucose 4,6-dehydratase
LLVTGGMGFIGSNFVHYLLHNYYDWEIVNLDKLNYAGNPDNLRDVESEKRYRFVRGDITDRELVKNLCNNGFDVIVNFAAESHVDRSILDPSPFIETNIKGTQILLEAAKQTNVGKFIQISTDEVYGSLGAVGKFSEESPVLPNNPYAASKAGADLMCHAYYQTYKLPVVITRCTNNYGPCQFPEKFIPLAITNALEDKEIPVYGDGLNVRDWIYVEDHCRAIDLAIQKGVPGEIYNVGGNNERSNLEVVRCILDTMSRPHSLITHVTDRLGHDRRYALETAKIEKSLGWSPAVSFGEGLELTVRWYLENEPWWRGVKSGEYIAYYDRMYGKR